MIFAVSMNAPRDVTRKMFERYMEMKNHYTIFSAKLTFLIRSKAGFTKSRYEKTMVVRGLNAPVWKPSLKKLLLLGIESFRIKSFNRIRSVGERYALVDSYLHGFSSDRDDPAHSGPITRSLITGASPFWARKSLSHI